MSVFQRKTFCVITGASRGYGKTLAEKFAERLKSSSVIVLSARDTDLLESLRQQLSHKHPLISFFCWQSDLVNSCYQQYTDFFQQLLLTNSLRADNFEQCLVVHNGATVGDVTQSTLKTTNRQEIDDYWRINVTSMLLLNATLLPMFNSQHQHQFVLNISSLAATVPFKGFSLYCTGKAAREQLLNCLALENEKIRLLHWCPGPMKTDMLNSFIDKTFDPTMISLVDDPNNLLTCEQSSKKLMALLQRDNHTNLSKVDYFDIDEDGNLLQKEDK